MTVQEDNPEDFDADADRINMPTEKPVKVRRKPLSPHYKANNEGGYGNPPVSGQRKKGDPGGPGRRKGETNINAALRKMFQSRVPVMKDGKRVTIPFAEALAERVKKIILSGSLRALQMGLEMMAKLGPVEEDTDAVFHFDDFSLDEIREFNRLMRKAQGLPTEEFLPPAPTISYRSWPDGITCKCERVGMTDTWTINTIRPHAYWSAALPFNLPPAKKD